MRLILDLNTVEPVTGSVADPETGASRPVAGWMSLMGAITDLAQESSPGDPAQSWGMDPPEIIPGPGNPT